jgi:hypothetical protein
MAKISRCGFGFLAGVLLVSCKTRDFNSNPTSEVIYGGVATSGPSGEERVYTPPFDFGIQFSKVTKEVSDDFWTSFQSKASFTGGLTLNDFVDVDLKPGRRYLNPAGKESVLRKATKKYIEMVGHWSKLECLALDDAAARAPNPVFKVIDARPPVVNLGTIREFELSASTLDEVGLNLGGLRAKMKAPHASKRYCEFKNWLGKLAPEKWLKPEFKIGLAQFDEVSRKPRWDAFSVHVRSSQSNENMLLVVNARVGLNDSRGHFSQGYKAEHALDAEFLVAGNYLIPTSTYSKSKAYVNPVLKFDPKTGDPVGFYDFAMLVIESLEEEKGITLTSVLSREVADLVKDPASRFRAGALYPLIPQFLDQTVTWDKVPVATHLPLYDRLPAGSLHFMINSAWSRASSTWFENVLVVRDVKKDDLKKLVLSGNLFINPYDDIRLHHSSEKDIRVPLDLLKEPGSCIDKRELAGKSFSIPEGHHNNHEAILGGTAGREFWQKNSRLMLIQKSDDGRLCASKI